jgi:hypothetical protein
LDFTEHVVRDVQLTTPAAGVAISVHAVLFTIQNVITVHINTVALEILHGYLDVLVAVTLPVQAATLHGLWKFSLTQRVHMIEHLDTI